MQKTVLFIDDQESILAATKRALESLPQKDLKVVTERRSRDALQRIRDWDPDIILLDLAMPSPSGIEVAQQIRDEKEFDRIPIVIYTRSNKYATKEELKQGYVGRIRSAWKGTDSPARVREILLDELRRWRRKQ